MALSKFISIGRPSGVFRGIIFPLYFTQRTGEERTSFPRLTSRSTKTILASSKTLGIVITDGVGFRNFVLSTFVTKAARSFEKVVIFSGLPSSAYPDLDASVFTIVELPVFTETKANWFWRKLKEVAHLQKHKSNPGIADNYKMNKAKSWSAHGLLVRLVYAVSSVFSKP